MRPAERAGPIVAEVLTGRALGLGKRTEALLLAQFGRMVV